MATKGYVLADTNGQPIGITFKYGGMYTYDKAVPFNIAVADTYHPYHLISAGDVVTGMVSGWTFNAGRTVDSNIASESNPSASILRITCSAPHGLSTGDLVVLENMNNAGHNKPTRITDVDGTSFDCDDIAYVAGAGASAGIVDQPATLKAGTGSDGNYFCSFNIDGTADLPIKDWKWEIFVNVTPQDNIVTERQTTASLASQSATGNINVAVGDYVYLMGKNISDTTDYTVKNFNLNLHKIG